MKAKILLLWMSTYLCGCLFAVIIPDFQDYTLAFSLVVLLISFMLMRKRWLFAIIFSLGIFSVSVWWFQSRVGDLTHENTVASSQELKVRVMVDDLPQKALHGDKVRLKVILSDIDISGQKFYGYFKDASDLKYAEVITTSVKIKPFQDSNKWRLLDNGVIGEGSINEYTEIGHKTGIWAGIKGGLLFIRKSLNEALARALPEKEAGLASGIIMGEKAMISPEMQNYLKASGTTHIIALSGYNITIILSAILLFRKRMSRLAGLLIPIVLIILFTVMTGGAPSLVRAAIMGSMPLMASFLYRESDSLIAIIFSATVMSILNPFLVLFDVGFQLSFMAFVGIIYIAPLISGILGKINFQLNSVLYETLGAQISTFPLISYYFGLISIVSPLTNFIILGLMPICMLMSFITAIMTITLPVFGRIISLPTYLLLQFVNKSIEWSGGLSWASTSIKIENPWWILMFYILIFDIWFYFRKVGRTVPTE